MEHTEMFLPEIAYLWDSLNTAKDENFEKD